MSEETLPQRWVAAWSADDPAAFAHLFAPNAIYIDYGSQLHRTRMDNHHKSWRKAIPNFTAVLDPSTPIWWAKSDIVGGKARTSCAFRVIMNGTFLGSLPLKSATGKDWHMVAMVSMEIEDGLIVRLGEFYRDSFEKGVPEDQFLRDV
ncbi:hypothetical protein B0J15DRAFT_554784 [Fusarium solani]|jgi:hypothetical protein|uniref:SnoaL-like domain-containing protein n=1 Tax=Fusarium solani TaxID=169388 RepID=A0A9P9G8N7_FUSSL|nr:uncharacterized protein B0J15DRAFT_554784 [Fusarium solani]KAH7234248.1 hypothetical protein B0J15DRAFT_554784 [Fusarium solani]